MKKTKFNRPKPIPPFKTLEEEANFYDTHDLSGFGKVPLMELPLLESEKEEVITVRLQKSVKEKLGKIARNKGINPSTLARMWIIEQLQKL